MGRLRRLLGVLSEVGQRVRPRDSRYEDEIDSLDPVEDAHRIVTILSNHVFPLDVFLAAELGQLTTFTVPSISSVLRSTGEYTCRGERRLDDTRAILYEILHPGPSSAAGEEMVEHLNEIHSGFPISNDDYLYTLSVFVLDTDAFIEWYGHRRLRPKERTAILEVYRRMGERMGIEGIPETTDAFWTWRREYERRAVRFHPSNREVANGLLDAAAKLAPAGMGWAVRPMALVLLHRDGRRHALGLEEPSLLATSAVRASLRLRQLVARRFTMHRDEGFWEGAFFRHYVTYPSGYERMNLGPCKRAPA